MVTTEAFVPLDPEAAAGLETPVVVVDIDRMDARIAAMAATMHDRDVALRPHAKTHKSIEVGRRQLAAGAAGLTVATIGEAELFAGVGFDDLFIAYPLIASGPKAGRLRELAAGCRLMVGADSTEGIELLATVFSAGSDAAPAVVIEVDVGGARTGVAPERAGILARAATDRGLVVRGVFTHGGHSYAGRVERLTAAEDEVRGLAAAADALRQVGIVPEMVSAGSTPTATLSAAGQVTEERPGTYVFGDRQQSWLAGLPLEDQALMVGATVVSHGAGGGFVIDAGAKILAKDVAPYLPGHGTVVGLPDAIISRLSDHHGVVDLPAGVPVPSIGTVVWVVPNHVCPVVNLVDSFLVAQGGRVVDEWAVDARGRNT